MRKWLTILLAALLICCPALAETADTAPTVEATEAADAAAPEATGATGATGAASDATPDATEAAEAVNTPDTTAAPITAATKTSVAGGFAARTERDIFAALPNGGKTALARVSREGGDPALVDEAEKISELVPIGGTLYYLREENGQATVNARAADGGVSTVYTFAEDTNPHNLCAFGSDLYVLIGDQMHVLYPGNGLCLKLVGEPMSEFVIVGDYAYFVSLNDQMTYETDSLLGGAPLTVTGGCLYRLNMNTGGTALLIKAGVQDLKYAGGKLYFHNLWDNYVMGSTEVEWMEGHLYSLDLTRQTMTRLLTDYDWGFYPATAGVSAYTADAITLYPDNGSKRVLYSPEGYMLLSGDDSGLIGYEQALGKLLLIYYDGTVADVGKGDMTAIAANPDTTPQPGATADPGVQLADDKGNVPTTIFDQPGQVASAGSAGGSGSTGSTGSSGGTGSTGGSGSTGSTGSTGGSGSSGRRIVVRQRILQRQRLVLRRRALLRQRLVLRRRVFLRQRLVLRRRVLLRQRLVQRRLVLRQELVRLLFLRRLLIEQRQVLRLHPPRLFLQEADGEGHPQAGSLHVGLRAQRDLRPPRL